jgi:hypothetical protein
VPEEMICWFVAHMKTGRPIVSLARVSILVLLFLALSPLSGMIHENR